MNMDSEVNFLQEFNKSLTANNFLIYAARNYNNPQCINTKEFLEDILRIKYVKKLITRYIEAGELRERLILNHLIVLSNVFKPPILCKILWLKMEDYLPYVKPFLILLNILPDKLYNINNEYIIDTTLVPMDGHIVEVLRKI